MWQQFYILRTQFVKAGCKGRKVCGNHVCLCDLLQLQQAQLRTAILSPAAEIDPVV